MEDIVPLKTGKGTAREQLLELAAHQARVQGKSLAQYLRELQAQIERKGEGGTAPRPVPAPVPREQYVYLTRREVEDLFDLDVPLIFLQQSRQLCSGSLWLPMFQRVFEHEHARPILNSSKRL